MTKPPASQQTEGAAGHFGHLFDARLGFASDRSAPMMVDGQKQINTEFH
jgi:hypothetical protein